MATSDQGDEPAPAGHGVPMRQWSRTAFGMAALFASLPLAGRLFAGATFDGALQLACLSAAAGIYLHLAGRKRLPVPDDAAVLSRALELAEAGERTRAIRLLSDSLSVSPKLWQAYQYRGQLRLEDPGEAIAALQDFSEAIRLAPGEAHLYVLRGHARVLAGDPASAQADYETAVRLSEPGAEETASS